MITIVDYGMGNLESIKNMVRKIGGKAEITAEISAIEKATKLILPGVGHFGKAMELIEKRNFKPVLNKKALQDKIPVLGICLGMQLLLDHSEECNCKGLGWIPGNVKKFSFTNEKLKVPHMGWTAVSPQMDSILFKDVQDELRFYFVHSFFASDVNPENILATSNYGMDFTSAVQAKNIMGTQFHPEKSHKFGMALLANFNSI